MSAAAAALDARPVSLVQPQTRPPPPLCMLRCLFLLSALSCSAWGRFGQIFYLRRGLTTVQIGMIEGLMPLVGVFAAGGWSYAADRFRARKAVYLLTTVAGTATLMLLAVPAVVERKFWRILAVSLGVRLWSAGGVLDAYALECLGGAHRSYGRLRLWGSIGWGGGALAMGAITARYGFGPNFAVFAGTNGLLVLALGCGVPGRSGGGEAGARPSSVALTAVLASRPLLAFLLEIFLFGAAVGVVERLLFVYVVDDLGGTPLLCGAIVFVSSLANVPVFMNGGYLLARLGEDGLTLSAYFCYVVRVYGYTLLTPGTRHRILALEILHGFTFATLWVAAVERARLMAPPGWGATLQTLLQTTYYSLGPGVGALVGGWIWHLKGAHFMYRAYAAAVAGLAVTRAARAVAAARRRRPKRPQVDAAVGYESVDLSDDLLPRGTVVED